MDKTFKLSSLILTFLFSWYFLNGEEDASVTFKIDISIATKAKILKFNKEKKKFDIEIKKNLTSEEAKTFIKEVSQLGWEKASSFVNKDEPICAVEAGGIEFQFFEEPCRLQTSVYMVNLKSNDSDLNKLLKKIAKLVKEDN